MNKLKRSIWPDAHSEGDFKCFGPSVTKDGVFDDCMICDMGCFKQDGVDTNKYYHAAVVESKQTGDWFLYVEWGKVGGATDFQFYECSCKDEAIKLFKKQLHSKNDKRGEWYEDKVLGKVLRAKKGKDCYLVRPQVVRSTGLPDARKISQVKTTVKKFKKEVQSLLDDLNFGTIEYARTSMSTSSIPTIEAINEARLICKSATKGDNLEELTAMLYSRIPKTKYKNEDYILGPNNIKAWLDDLDAYEDAINGIDVKDVKYNFELEYVKKGSRLDKFIRGYIRKATANRHGWCSGDMIIKNIWKVNRDSDLENVQEKIIKLNRELKEKPFHISEKFSRIDVDLDKVSLYNDTNTHLMFHGTRSVNVSGILNSGLKLPKELKGVSINGAMFGGSGLYWADDWKKSAGYCSLRNSYWARGSGDINNRDAFMFICDVVLGEPYIAPGPYGFIKPPKGYDCVLGKANVSGVANNEFITYEKESHNIRYLIEFAV